MIEHWVENDCEAFWVMGWPEWEGKYGLRRLVWRANITCGGYEWAFKNSVAIAPHVALCIIRDWAREYLRKFHVAVWWDVVDGQWIIVCSSSLTPKVIRRRIENLTHRSHFDDEDLALITAMLATGGKG